MSILLAINQSCTTVEALHIALLLQDAQIGTNGRLGQLEGIGKHFDRRRAVFADHVEDLFAPLLHFRQLFAFAFQSKDSCTYQYLSVPAARFATATPY